MSALKVFITLLGRWTQGGKHYEGEVRGYRSPEEALNPQVGVREGFLEEEVISKPTPEE